VPASLAAVAASRASAAFAASHALCVAARSLHRSSRFCSRSAARAFRFSLCADALALMKAAFFLARFHALMPFLGLFAMS